MRVFVVVVWCMFVNQPRQYFVLHMWCVLWRQKKPSRQLASVIMGLIVVCIKSVNGILNDADLKRGGGVC